MLGGDRVIASNTGFVGGDQVIPHDIGFVGGGQVTLGRTFHPTLFNANSLPWRRHSLY